METRSKAQQNFVPPEDDTVAINYCFFHPKYPMFRPYRIEISRTLYSSQAQDSRKLFCDEIRGAYRFCADLDSIEFWQPDEPLSHEADEEIWSKYLELSQRSKIPLTRSFQSELIRVEDEYLVHLIVTAAEEDDGITGTPEYKRYRKAIRRL